MWEQIRNNRINSFFLVIVMAWVLMLLGYFLGEMLGKGMGINGLMVATTIWLIMSFVSFFKGDSIFLSMSNARKIDHTTHPALFNIVEEMTIAAGLPRTPDVYIIDDPAPNAFATGRDPRHASVAVTSGLLNMLNRDELQGVIAHELGHIKNRDTLYMTMVGIMLGAIVLLADMGRHYMFWGSHRSRTSSREEGNQIQIVITIVGILLIILAPFIAQLVYFAVSRKREYLADASAALFTRYPVGLASALNKISGTHATLQAASSVTAPMYIINPLQLKKGTDSKDSWFSTHPSTNNRIKILRSMTSADLLEYNKSANRIIGTSSVIPASSAKAGHTIASRSGAAAPGDTDSTIERTRTTTDAFWKMNNYTFINCTCGTRLKLPPTGNFKKVMCPHCQTILNVPQH